MPPEPPCISVPVLRELRGVKYIHMKRQIALSPRKHKSFAFQNSLLLLLVDEYKADVKALPWLRAKPPLPIVDIFCQIFKKEDHGNVNLDFSQLPIVMRHSEIFQPTMRKKFFDRSHFDDGSARDLIKGRQHILVQSSLLPIPSDNRVQAAFHTRNGI